MPLVNRPQSHSVQDAPLDTAPADLNAQDPSERRRAVQSVSGKDAVSILDRALGIETDASVLSAIFAALRQIGDAEVADRLAAHLSSERTALRTGAVATLKELGSVAAPALKTALDHKDPDVRIMAVDALQDLRCEECVSWLADLLMSETHPNVVGAALDRLVEIGSHHEADVIRSVPARFPDDPFIAFASERALQSLMQDQS